MSEIECVESKVQQHVLNFVKILPNHEQEWRNVLQESTIPLEALTNKVEQLSCVCRAYVGHMDDFENVKSDLLFNISNAIEEELILIQNLISRLQQSNVTLKNKLFPLENLTIDLDWDRKVPLITGTHSQPALSLLLERAYEYWIYFSKALKDISDSFKNLNFKEEESIRVLKRNFDLDLDNSFVRNLLLITQYINNEKAIV